MMQKRLLVVVTALVCLLPAAHAANWDQPAADLAKQIAALAGPGPARLSIRNDSSLPTTDVPVIRRLLERNLRTLGVLTGGNESATLLRVTLSENLQGGLWVTEVVEGTETRVTMLPVALGTPTVAANGPAITLRRTLLLTEPNPVLDAQIFTANGIQRLLVLGSDRLVSYMRNAAPLVATGETGWLQDQTFAIAHARPFPRDLRGRLVAAKDHLFDAYLPGVACSGSMVVAQLAVTCQESDDPWPISSTQRAFYNAMRNYYTGILAPGYGMELAPFYQASDIPRVSGSAVLLNETDGRVMLIENNVLKPVSGANDWGSDFAMLRSGCGSGAQVLVSGSGAAATGDNLRAWEIVGREAIAVSAPISIEGTVTAIQGTTTQGTGDGNTATVIVRQEAPTRYEVWNASALCN
jgi:hypothetical protein